MHNILEESLPSINTQQFVSDLSPIHLQNNSHLSSNNSSSMTDKQEHNPAPIPMGADDYSNFPESGIFFNAAEDSPTFLQFSSSPHFVNDPSFSFIPKPFTICSSLQGRFLCRVETLSNHSTYYILDPFSKEIPKPLPKTPNDFFRSKKTEAVLAFDHHTMGFIVLCAVEMCANEYIFNSLNVADSVWEHYMLPLPKISIIPGSGVASGECVYWLTEKPTSILRVNGITSMPKIIKGDIIKCLPPEARLQLGRVKGRISLVCVSEFFVSLYLLVEEDNSSWRSLDTLQLRLSLRTDEWGVRGRSIVCSDKPIPLRFDGKNARVMLLVRGKLAVWEIDVDGDGRIKGQGTVMEIPSWKPEWQNLPIEKIVNSVPYACYDVTDYYCFLSKVFEEEEERTFKIKNWWHSL